MSLKSRINRSAMASIGRNLSAIAVLFMLGGPLAACNQERNESIRLMNEGIRLYRNQRVDRAAKLLADAVKTDPTNDRAHYFEGMIRFQKFGDAPKAEELLRKAIELNNDDADYHYQLGAVLAATERHPEAVDQFEQTLKLKPDHAEAQLRLGRSLETLERFDAAQVAYREAVKGNPRLPEAYNALGMLYFRFEQYAHAAQVLKNAVENIPDFAQNYHDLGLVYQAQHRFDDAVAQFKHAMDLEPGQASAMFNLGMTYLAQNNSSQALLMLKRYQMLKTATEDTVRAQTARDIVMRLEAEQLNNP